MNKIVVYSDSLSTAAILQLQQSGTIVACPVCKAPLVEVLREGNPESLKGLHQGIYCSATPDDLKIAFSGFPADRKAYWDSFDAGDDPPKT
jgi:hypothetical protein